MSILSSKRCQLTFHCVESTVQKWCNRFLTLIGLQSIRATRYEQPIFLTQPHFQTLIAMDRNPAADLDKSGSFYKDNQFYSQAIVTYLPLPYGVCHENF